MPRRPVVLLHGYGSKAASLRRWRDALLEEGHEPTAIHLGEYISLSNEITIKDIAEGFDRALREQMGLGPEEPFDAIVHSTGGLVIRDWLVTYARRQQRLKRLVALAPATFGSPLAHRGRSWLGAVFRGERELGPDFLEAGQQVLSGLELGSRYGWELAHKDLLSHEPVYGETSESPFPFVFIGTGHYGFLRRAFANDPGTDGTVRWAAAGFDTRKIVVDLRREPGAREGGRVDVAPWHNVRVPLVLLPELNHTSILTDPPGELVTMVAEALEVEDLAGYQAWSERYATDGPRLDEVDVDRWQQFVVRAVDERGDPVRDFYLEVGSVQDGEFEPLDDFGLDVHAFTDDHSLRCFHVNLTRLDPDARPSLALRLKAESGTDLVGYHGQGSETFTRTGRPVEEPGVWDAKIDLTPFLRDTDVRFFFPYTTTLVEIRLNREPMPAEGVSRLLRFVEG